MLDELAERFVKSCEGTAEALTRIADVHEMRLQRDFPPKKEVRDAEITKIPSEEDKIREAQGGEPGESVEDWLDLRERRERDEEELGPRERNFVGTKKPKD